MTAPTAYRPHIWTTVSQCAAQMSTTCYLHNSACIICCEVRLAPNMPCITLVSHHQLMFGCHVTHAQCKFEQLLVNFPWSIDCFKNAQLNVRSVYNGLEQIHPCLNLICDVNLFRCFFINERTIIFWCHYWMKYHHPYEEWLLPGFCLSRFSLLWLTFWVHLSDL